MFTWSKIFPNDFQRIQTANHKYIWNNFLSQITEFFLKRQIELQFFLFGQCNFLIFYLITLKNWVHIWKTTFTGKYHIPHTLSKTVLYRNCGVHNQTLLISLINSLGKCSAFLECKLIVRFACIVKLWERITRKIYSVTRV